MTTNESIGITSSTNKNIQEIERRLAGIIVDYDYYSTGFPFVAVEPQSANHLFGNGKWKKTVINAIGEDTFKDYCEKYGNKPIDIKIAKIQTPQAAYFAPNEEIKIQDENGIYSKTTKVISIENGGVIIMCPFKGTSKGKLINISRKNGAEKSVKRHQQMLADLKPGIYNEKKQVSNMTSEVMDAPQKKKHFKLTTKQIIGGAIVVSLIIGIALYYDYKSKTK